MAVRKPRRLPLALAAVALVAALGTLSGCTGLSGTKLQPPAASIQQLTVQPDGSWAVVVRIQNNSYDTGMYVRSVDASVSVGGKPAGRLNALPGLDIAAMDADVFTATLTPDPAGSAALASAGRNAVAYKIEGSMAAGKNRNSGLQSFDLDGSGYISPVPGVSNTWR